MFNKPEQSSFTVFSLLDQIIESTYMKQNARFICAEGLHDRAERIYNVTLNSLIYLHCGSCILKTVISFFFFLPPFLSMVFLLTLTFLNLFTQVYFLSFPLSLPPNVPTSKLYLSPCFLPRAYPKWVVSLIHVLYAHQ